MVLDKTQKQINNDSRKSDNKDEADFQSAEESAQTSGNDSSISRSAVAADSSGGHGMNWITETKTQTVSKQGHTKIDGHLTAPTNTFSRSICLALLK